MFTIFAANCTVYLVISANLCGAAAGKTREGMKRRVQRLSQQRRRGSETVKPEDPNHAIIRGSQSYHITTSESF
jgi:hypothetical protein